MKKKTISLALAVILVFCMVGCGKKSSRNSKVLNEDTSSKQHDASTVTLLFNKSDSLNPYTAKTENNRLVTKLIFEPLVKTDNDIKPVYRLADDVKLDGKSCKVTIKSTLFADGTAVTADDVVYSCNLAKNSGGLYSSHLYEVSSAVAVSKNTVNFSLTRYDPYFVNLLDFPIIKSGSDKISDSDGNLKSPVGCGRYMQTEDPYVLTQNQSFFGKKGDIKEIKLINAPDDDSVSHYIEVGATDLYYSDLSNGSLVRMSGKRTDINLNNLIYIGINTSASVFKDKYMRYAISSAIDRTAICRDAYFNSGSVATGYFNPSLSKTNAVQTLSPTADLQITVDNLQKIGYNDKNADGYYVDDKGKHHIFKLLVNKENNSRLAAANLIAQQLKSAGIELTVVECSYTDYINRLSSNSFELYLGEISILPNFDMSPLVLSDGAAAYGIKNPTPAEEQTAQSEAKKDESETEAKSEEKPASETETVRGIYAAYFNNDASISDIAGTLLTEMLQIPLVYRHGLLFSNEHILNITSSESDIFFSIEDYKIK